MVLCSLAYQTVGGIVPQPSRLNVAFDVSKRALFERLTPSTKYLQDDCEALIAWVFGKVDIRPQSQLTEISQNKAKRIVIEMVFTGLDHAYGDVIPHDPQVDKRFNALRSELPAPITRTRRHF